MQGAHVPGWARCSSTGRRLDIERSCICDKKVEPRHNSLKASKKTPSALQKNAENIGEAGRELHQALNDNTEKMGKLLEIGALWRWH